MGKNKTGVILIVVLLVALLVLFIFGFFALYKALNKANSDEPNASVVLSQEVPIEDITNFAVKEEPIITNLLKGPDKKEHIIKFNVSLGINTSKKVKKEATKLLTTLETQKLVIEDIIIGVCLSKTYEELSDNNARTILKDEILAKVQQAFNTNLIVDVYLSDLLIQ